MNGPWYQHVFVSFALLIYVSVVLFFVSSGLYQEVMLTIGLYMLPVISLPDIAMLSLVYKVLLIMNVCITMCW